MYIRTDGTTAGLLAGENTQPLTHPTTRQKTTKHCVSTESTFRPDGTSVEKKCAPLNSSASSHTGSMAGHDRNDGVPSRLRGGVRAGPTAVGPALRRPLRPQPPRPPSCCATAPPSLPSVAAAAPLRRRGWATAVVASAAVERHAARRKRIAPQRGGGHRAPAGGSAGPHRALPHVPRPARAPRQRCARRSRARGGPRV